MVRGLALISATSITALFALGVLSTVAAGPAAPTVTYVHDQGTGLARAFCPGQSKLVGGGAFVETPAGGSFRPEALRQSHPISDPGGQIAWGNVAVGWQAASSNFEDTVVAFAMCATPKVAKTLTVEYVNGQAEGVARAFCPAGTTLTGGGAFVETPPSGTFQPESLRQSHPISDNTGTIAYGNVAVGWQAASSNFEDHVAAFAICASSTSAGFGVQYVSAQATGVARATCASGDVSGGGAFVETPPSQGYQPEILRQSYPISEATGTIAHGTRAIGWQAASSNFEDVAVAFAVCAQF